MKFAAALLLVVAVATVSKSYRIVGGQFAEEHQFPYQVALYVNGKFNCGGSVIDSRWILTASHCVLDYDGKIPVERLQVHVGSSTLGNGQFHDVVETFPHDKYGNFQNDVALIKLFYMLEFNEAVQPIELNTVYPPVGAPVTISGFGRIGMGYPISEQLKYNTVTVESKENCRKATGIPSEGLICLNSPEDNGACNGDSGGPAVYNGKLVGLANFVVHGCGSADPDGYSDVAYFLNWITETMEKF